MGFAIKHLEQAKERILAEKHEKVIAATENLTKSLQPKFSEMDRLKDQALNKLAVDYNKARVALTEQYNTQVIALQNQLELDKKAVNDSCENNKADMLANAVNTEIADIEKECILVINAIDTEIAKLTAEV